MHYKEFEDNSGAIELARLPKIRPHTKHINVVFHHFCEYARKGLIRIQKFSTDDQCADAWTKLLPQNVLLNHRKFVFGF